MDHRCSFGPTSAEIEALGPQDDGVRGRSRELRGSAVNYPGNPRFRPRVAFKFANTSEEMEQMCIMLTNHALVISDEGPLAVQSREEVKDLIIQHFGIRKHELYVYRSHPEPFIIVFSEGRARDFVFATRRLVEGPTELSFHSWDLDQFGTRDCIPYHVRRCIEGIPHHAWCRETTEKVMCDEALIHHVEEASVDRSDQRSFNCWVFTKDPSRISQTVFLSLLSYEIDPWKHDLVNFSMPRSVKHTHVFQVLVHIDTVEDLLFYHHPREDLIKDGKVPWKEFAWRSGHANGDLEEDELHPLTRSCGQVDLPKGHHWDDDDSSGDRGHPRSRGIINHMAN
jgi:hypothetical protein